MEAFFLEKYNLKQIVLPVDLNTAANPGARISMKNARRITFVVNMGDSTAASTLSAALKQHNAASSGTTKALSVANPYYHKLGAATKFTKVEPGSAADTYDLAALFAGDEGIAVFEVLAEDLDTNNGFAWCTIDIADAGAAKVGAVMAIVEPIRKPAYSQDI